MNDTLEETTVEVIEKSNFWTRHAPAAKAGLVVLGLGVIIGAVAAKFNQNDNDE